MQLEKLDGEYINLVKDILFDDKFLVLKDCEHHGMSRYDHSLKVSYQAYQYAKKHNMDVKAIARGGLLHDFFITEKMSFYQKLKSTFNHPHKACLNASYVYNVDVKEANIISSHMFPISSSLPKYKESWIVSYFDKKVALSEFSLKFNWGIKYAVDLTLLLILNFIK